MKVFFPIWEYIQCQPTRKIKQYVLFWFWLLFAACVSMQSLQAQTVSVQKVPQPGEAIVVQYSNLPGNKKDWITITPQSSKANEYGEWHYTEGKRNGTMQFKPLDPGNYE